MRRFFDDKPDILCLQETKAAEEQIPKALLHIDGYHSHFISAGRKGYSGVGLYSRMEPKRVLPGFGVARFDSEGER